MYKLKLLLLPVAWLLAFMALACAPPDDDAPSSGPSGPSGPTINNAIYDFATALLTIKGSNLSPTQVQQTQIQTIKVYGVVLNSYTADDDATGVNSNGLEQGKYRLHSDGTALWLRLTDADKATLNGKVGSNGLKKGLLSVGSGSWAGLNTAKDLDVRNIPAAEQVDDQSPKQTEDEQAEQVEQAEEESPKAAITGASYHVGTALLTLQGTDLGSATQAQIQTIVVDGVALSSYTADGTATGADSSSLAKGKYRLHSDGTALWLKLTDQHKAALNGKDGMDSNGLKDGLLASSGTWAGLNTAKALAVSGNPAITRASYHVGTALLTLQGTDLGSATQAQIQTIVVDGVALSSYIADGTATGADSSSLAKGKYRIANDGTALWLKLTDQHKAALNGKDGMDSNGLKDGLLASSGTWAGLDTAKALAVSGNPAITRASYHVGTALLTLQGTRLGSATQAQIQTITVDGLALSSYIADATDTGPDSRGLAKGKYRLHSAGTALWLKLTDQHKAALNGKDGMDSNGLKDGLLASSGTWAGLDTAKALAVSGNPAITRASYHVGTALLTLQGTRLGSATQAQIQTITVDGLALSSYIADATDTGPDSRGLAKGKYRMKSDGTALWLKLTDQHKAALNGKTGMDSNGLKDGLLSVGTGTWAGLDTAKALAVSGNPAPTITRATYNAATSVLVITGVNLPKAVTGWDFTKLRLVAGNGRKSQPLLGHNPKASDINRATGSAASATSLTITLRGSEYTKAIDILVKNGDSDDAGAYNLEAAAGFAGGRAEDTSNNPITVSGYVVGMSIVRYFADDGELNITGTNLPTTVAGWDFSKLTIVSGDGSKRYTLPRHATTGENTATGIAARITILVITLSGSVKAEVNKILVKNGLRDDAGAYKLEVAAGFVIGGSADSTTKIKVFGVGK